MAGQVTHRAARSSPAHREASGAVDNPTSAKLHLTKSNSCPTKWGHLSWQVAIINEKLADTEVMAKFGILVTRKSRKGLAKVG
ncbi:hypothetical protein ASE07_24930 [Noviherbaspirillum sp. Root189]|nr:hypothetical protein ASE07_24930 [Noviherbaspirillum sp. Root189]